MTISTEKLIDDLQNLGIQPGYTLLVHISLRKVGWVTDGPVGVIQALLAVLGKTGTLVMPTMTDGETLFDPLTTPTEHMGIVAETFWRQSGVQRSNHPGGSFAAIGPLASLICAEQPIDPPHGLDSPPGRVYQQEGWILLLGVDHDANTTIHVAENISNVPYRIMDRVPVKQGDTIRWVEYAEVNHCCRNFTQIGPILRQQNQLIVGQVGEATAQLVRSVDVVTTARGLIAQDPYYFLCPPGQCPYDNECDEARSYAKG